MNYVNKKSLEWSISQSCKSSSIHILITDLSNAYDKGTMEFISGINFKREAS